MKIRLHAFEPASRANGPGLRAVVWFQGCTLDCEGCFNPATHNPHGGYESDSQAISAEILALGTRIEGISISGGEPFQQPEGLLDVLRRLNSSGLSRLVFSGYALSEIRSFSLGPEILSHIDVLVAGRFVAARNLHVGLLGSGNQQLHLLTTRYTASELARVPSRELILRADGTVTASGIAPWWPST
jgi:anaerobic ribonucleoside-triphosphate reductase activating protein